MRAETKWKIVMGTGTFIFLLCYSIIQFYSNTILEFGMVFGLVLILISVISSAFSSTIVQEESHNG